MSYKIDFRYADYSKYGDMNSYKVCKRDFEIDLVQVNDHDYTDIEVENIRYNNAIIIGDTYYNVEKLFLRVGIDKNFICYVRNPKDDSSDLPF